MSLEINSTNFLTDANLKAYYRFSTGALTTDSSGEGHTLTAISDPAEDASGKFGGAVALDGNDAYSATDHADFKPTGNFTVGVWFKTSNTGVAQILFSSASRNTNWAGWRINTNTSDGVAFIVGRNTGTVLGTDYRNVIKTGSYQDGNWHFAVGTWDGSNLVVYVDGVASSPEVWSNATGYAATNYVRVGCENVTGTDGAFFTGSLDDVFLINGTALSADQIKAIYLGLNWTSINGLGIASIKDINGLAKESIKSFNGLS